MLGLAILSTTLATGCTPADRRAAGAATTALGLVTAGVGADLVDPCLFADRKHPRYPDPPDPCRSGGPGHDGAAPQAGFDLIFIGLSSAVLGGILYGTGIMGSGNQSRHGAAAPPSSLQQQWPTPQREGPDF